MNLPLHACTMYLFHELNFCGSPITRENCKNYTPKIFPVKHICTSKGYTYHTIPAKLNHEILLDHPPVQEYNNNRREEIRAILFLFSSIIILGYVQIPACLAIHCKCCPEGTISCPRLFNDMSEDGV